MINFSNDCRCTLKNPWWQLLVPRASGALILFLLLLLNVSTSFAQPGTACSAHRWDAGDGWRFTNGEWVPTTTNGPQLPQGIVACASAAATESNLQQYKSTYALGSFDLSQANNCFNHSGTFTPPSVGEDIIWLNFDIRPLAGTFQFQLENTGGATMGWALYYSTTSSPGAGNPGPSYPAVPGTSGDCTSLVYAACGISFTGWETITVPSFLEATNYYLVMWAQDPNVTVIDKNTIFKARFGCGGATCTLEKSDTRITCNADGTYTVCQDYFGSAGSWDIVAPGSSSTTVTTFNQTGGVVATGTTKFSLGTIPDGAIKATICTTYPVGAGYSVTLTPNGEYQGGSGYVACMSGGSYSGTSPTVPTVIGTANPTTINLATGNTSTLSASASGGTGPYIYNWTELTPDAFTSLTNGSNGAGTFTITGLPVPPVLDLTYNLRLTATDALGCAGIDDVPIIYDGTLEPCGIYGPETICEDAGNIVYTYGAGGVPYTLKLGNFAYKWTITGNGTIESEDDNTGTVTVKPNGDGNFTLTMTIDNTTGILPDVSCQLLVTVNPNPTVDAGAYGPLCTEGADIALVGSPAGGTFTGTGVSGSIATGFVFDPSVGTQTLTYSYSVNGCGGSDQVTITVNPNPTVDAGAYGPLCTEGDPIALVGSPAGGTWTGTGVSGSIATGFTFDPSSGTQTLTYSYSVNGCGGSDQVTITVSPNPTVDAGAYGPLCTEGDAIALVGSPAGGTWTGTGVSGSIATGFTFDPSAGTQTLTYTYSVNGCGGSDQVTITVNPNPIVDAGAYGPLCTEGDAIALVGSPAGGTWTGTGVSGSIATGFTFDPSSGTQTLTYTYSVNGCGGSDQVTITVNPNPIVDAGAYGPLCTEGDPIALVGSPAGGTWTGTGVSGSIATGFTFDPSVGTQTLTYSYSVNGCGGSDQVMINVSQNPTVDAGAYGPLCTEGDPIALVGSPAGGTFTGTGVSGSIATGFTFDPSVGTQTLTYTYSVNGCGGSDQVTITVNPNPIVDAGVYGPLCTEGDAIPLVGSPAGGTWTGTGVSGSIATGFVFDPSAGTQTLTYSYSVNGCGGSDQVTITVNPNPTVDAGAYGPLCTEGDPIALVGSPAGGTWTGTGVSGSIATGFTFDPSSGTQTLTYSYSVNGCGGSDQVTITVSPNPTVDAGAYGPLCTEGDAIALVGSPAGGTWTGTGVSGSIATGFTFDPSAGTQTLTYTYSVNGCGGSDQVTITVNPNPIVDAGAYGPLCTEGDAIALVGSPAGGTWTGTGVSGSIATGFTFDPSSGTQTLTYTYSVNGCGGSDQVTITVNPNPIVDAGAYGPVCTDAADIALVGSPTGGTWTGTGVSGSIATGFVFDPSVGTQTLTYTYSVNGCGGSDQATITVNPNPIVDAGSYGLLCTDAADIPLVGSPAGGTFTGIGVSGSIATGFVFDPSVGTQTLTYTYSVNGCGGSDQVTITTQSCITGKGCTPGFWKNHPNVWDKTTDFVVNNMPGSLTSPVTPGGTFTTTTKFYTYFNIPVGTCGLPNNANLTMLQATGTGGGNCNALARHGVSALLGAAAFPGEYPYPAGMSSFADLYNAIRTAFLTCNCGPLHLTLAAINELDGEFCGALQKLPQVGSPSSIPTKLKVTDVFVKAYPNPYSTEINFSLVSPVSGQGLLEVYDVVGRKIAVVFQGRVDANISRNVKYLVPATLRETLVYKFTVDGSSVVGKLMPGNKTTIYQP